MRQNYSFSKNSNVLLEPCEGKLSCTVLRGESPSNGADLLDNLIDLFYTSFFVDSLDLIKMDLYGKSFFQQCLYDFLLGQTI